MTQPLIPKEVDKAIFSSDISYSKVDDTIKLLSNYKWFRLFIIWFIIIVLIIYTDIQISICQRIHEPRVLPSVIMFDVNHIMAISTYISILYDSSSRLMIKTPSYQTVSDGSIFLLRLLFIGCYIYTICFCLFVGCGCDTIWLVLILIDVSEKNLFSWGFYSRYLSLLKQNILQVKRHYHVIISSPEYRTNNKSDEEIDQITSSFKHEQLNLKLNNNPESNILLLSYICRIAPTLTKTDMIKIRDKSHGDVRDILVDLWGVDELDEKNIYNYTTLFMLRKSIKIFRMDRWVRVIDLGNVIVFGTIISQLVMIYAIDEPLPVLVKFYILVKIQRDVLTNLLMVYYLQEYSSVLKLLKFKILELQQQWGFKSQTIYTLLDYFELYTPYSGSMLFIIKTIGLILFCSNGLLFILLFYNS